MSPADPGLNLAVVILAGRATPADRERVAEMVATARALGAHAIIVAVPRGWRAPAHARVVHATPGAPPIGAVRLAMAQLSNTPARYALMWRLDAADDAHRLRALLDEVARGEPRLVSFEGEDPEHAPMMVAREVWLELMTIGEQGMSALSGRLGARLIAARPVQED